MAVPFHVSHAQIAVGITMDVYRRNLTFKLMVVDDHIGRSRWKMDAAFPILARSSDSESQSLDMYNNGRNGSCLTWLATSLEEKRRWLVINASPRGQCSK